MNRSWLNAAVVAVGALTSGAALSAWGAAPAPAHERPGKAFFQTKVFPKLVENGCPMCHARGYLSPNVLIYEQLLPYLAMGDAPEKSAVIRKIANLRPLWPDIPTHPGGVRCETLASEPCKSITEWWQVEFGVDAGATESKR